MGIERDKEYICITCNKLFKLNDVLEKDSYSIPHFSSSPKGVQAICYDCTSKGNTFCSREDCKEPYKKNYFETEKYHLLYEIKTPLIEVQYMDKSRYCCNECFNLDVIENEISMFNMTILEVDILKLFPNDIERLAKAKEEIIRLNKIKNEIIKKRENN